MQDLAFVHDILDCVGLLDVFLAHFLEGEKFLIYAMSDQVDFCEGAATDFFDYCVFFVFLDF